MSRKKIALEMVALYLQGVAPRQIGEIYGVRTASVLDRLEKMGCEIPSRRRWRPIAAAVDKERLNALYTDERLNYDQIAAKFGVSPTAIGKALKLYGIPKRPPLCPVPCRFVVLRKLKIGDRAKIFYRDEKQVTALRRAAKDFGIFIKLRVERNERFIEVMRVSKDELQRISDITAIDRTELEEMRCRRKLTTAQIALRFGAPAELIRQALLYYRIPDPPSKNVKGGKYIDVFRRLRVSETEEIECAAKRPYQNLHSIAALHGMKISIHKIAEGRYEITKLL